MKIKNTTRQNAIWFALLFTLSFVLGASRAHAQPNANPPNLMTYQGYLVDANGGPLGTNAPKNYDVIFRIWDAATGGNKLWTEQQTVTVDKGYFSVLLGEGSSIGETRPVLNTIFTNSTASDRWVGMTVKGIGSGGSDSDILPRLRLLSAPYALLASKVSGSGVVAAANIDPAIGLWNSSGANVYRSGGNVGIGTSSPGFPLNFANVLGDKISLWGNSDTSFGFGVQGSLLQIHSDAAGSDIAFGYGSSASMTERMRIKGNTGNVGIGITAPTDKLHVVGNIRASGSIIGSIDGANLNASSVDLTKLVAAVKESLCPPGTIIAYAGDSAPAGWLMCDGQYGQNPLSYPALFATVGYRFGGFTSAGVHYFLTPDLRGRFLRGRDGGAGRDPDRASRSSLYGEGATGDAVGSLQGDQFRSHTHQWLGSNGNNSPADVDFTAGEFGSKNQYQDTLSTGGSETRPVNVYVNYIIKY